MRPIQVDNVKVPLGGLLAYYTTLDTTGAGGYIYALDGVMNAEGHESGDTWTFEGITFHIEFVGINRGEMQFDGERHTLLEVAGD
ncbi:hypothetical protein ACFVWR_15385 [Leifsonia sp. NPDC058292]|uniref:hypothetical protein n=1 Tax=Leifsonia sp. NPDC058292 TaxID=3346428 RepID=UPI0036DC0051